MQYHFPDYYYTFQCIGSLCPDTCCAGWNIEIDSISLANYKKLIHDSNQGWPLKARDPFFADLKKAVDFRNKTFRLSERRCPLLTEDNLCGMYLHLGKNSLCRTCRTYPRHQEEFGNLREISLSLSCPEAARIILSQPSRPVLISRETMMECPSDQLVDESLLSWLLAARERILDILWDLRRPFEISVAMALAFAHDLQRRHLDQRYYEPSSQDEEPFFNLDLALEDLDALTRNYLAPKAEERFSEQVRRLNARKRKDSDGGKRDTGHVSLLPSALLHLYSDLEPVVENWPRLLSGCHFLPSYDSLQERQLLTYFIQVYFPGAIYDDDIFGKIQFAAASLLMTRMLCGALLSDSEKEIPPADLFTKAAYLYSRQTENSDSNLNAVFDALQTRRPFQFYEFLAYFSQNPSCGSSTEDLSDRLTERNFS